MLYQRRTFTCPAAPSKTSQRNWDFSTLTREEFLAKYGQDAAEYAVHSHPKTHSEHTTPHAVCLECA